MPNEHLSAPPGALTERQLAQNGRVFIVEMALFQVAMSLISATTVVPAFINELTHSEPLVGLASSIQNIAWLLPQLFVAGVVARARRKKPIMVTSAWIGRTLMLVLGLAIFWGGQRAPLVTLITVLAGIVVFFVVDAVVSIAWFDMAAVGIVPSRRGRVLGTGQVLGGLGGIGAGVAVRFLLSDAAPWPFPRNYALLFALAGIVFMLSALALSLLREPPAAAESQESAPTFRAVLRAFPRILLHDRGFQWATVVRTVACFCELATAFYVLYGLNKLGFRIADTGLFISAQVAGTVLAGLLMGVVQDRWGPLAHIRTLLALAILPPALALLAGPVAAAWHPGAWALYLLLYFCLGLYMGTSGWPFLNWLTEYAPAAQRPLYFGLANTLAAIPMLAPALGGLIVRNISYPAVFVAALCFALLGLALAPKVPDTRAAQAQAQDSAR